MPWKPIYAVPIFLKFGTHIAILIIHKLYCFLNFSNCFADCIEDGKLGMALLHVKIEK